MPTTFEDEIKDEVCGDVFLRVECKEREVTIEDSCGRRCVIEYSHLEALNKMVKKYQAMLEIANG